MRETLDTMSNFVSSLIKKEKTTRSVNKPSIWNHKDPKKSKKSITNQNYKQSLQTLNWEDKDG